MANFEFTDLNNNDLAELLDDHSQVLDLEQLERNLQLLDNVEIEEAIETEPEFTFLRNHILNRKNFLFKYQRTQVYSIYYRCEIQNMNISLGYYLSACFI